jgi:hypothetical protein
LSELAELSFTYNFTIEAIWLETTRNVPCDMLSRCFTHYSHCTCFTPHRLERVPSDQLCTQEWSINIARAIDILQLNPDYGYIATDLDRYSLQPYNDYLQQ